MSRKLLPLSGGGIRCAHQRPKCERAGACAGPLSSSYGPGRRVYFRPSGRRTASSLPALLSCDTTITPLAGVCAHSTGSIDTGLDAEPPAGTTWKSPFEIAGDQTLNAATSGTASNAGERRSNVTMWYVRRGFPVFDRQGSDARQS